MTICSTSVMISLTRLNHEPVVVNADLIVLIESKPDTVLKLSTGEFVRVLETRDEVVDRVVDFRRRLIADHSRQLEEFAYALQ